MFDNVTFANKSINNGRKQNAPGRRDDCQFK